MSKNLMLTFPGCKSHILVLLYDQVKCSDVNRPARPIGEPPAWPISAWPGWRLAGQAENQSILNFKNQSSRQQPPAARIQQPAAARPAGRIFRRPGRPINNTSKMCLATCERIYIFKTLILHILHSGLSLFIFSCDHLII